MSSYLLIIRYIVFLTCFFQRYAELIAADPEIGPEESMPLDCLAAFNSLWVDKGVQLAILKGNQYALHDNLS